MKDSSLIDSGLIRRLIKEKLPVCDVLYCVVECCNGVGMISGLVKERLDARRGLVNFKLEFFNFYIIMLLSQCQCASFGVQLILELFDLGIIMLLSQCQCASFSVQLILDLLDLGSSELVAELYQPPGVLYVGTLLISKLKSEPIGQQSSMIVICIDLGRELFHTFHMGVLFSSNLKQ